MKFFYSLFLILIFGAVVAIFLFRAGWYPLALVNGDLIWGFFYEQEVNLALKYYDQLIKDRALNEMQKEDINVEIRRSALEKIIQDVVLADRAEGDLGATVQSEIDSRLAKYMTDKKLEEVANNYFNMTLENFKKMILEPQALKEIYAEKFKADKKDFNSWFKERLRAASVTLFTSEYKFNKGVLELNN